MIEVNKVKTPVITGKIQDTRDLKGRFKKGVSGNPKGKPLGATSFKSDLRRTLEYITSKKKNSDPIREIMTSVIEKASGGDIRAIGIFFSYVYGKPNNNIDVGISEELEEGLENIKKLTQEGLREKRVLLKMET